MNNQTHTTILSVYTCLIIDLKTRQECSTTNPNVCVKCPALWGFLTGELMTDFGETGHLISFVLWIFILLVGGFGILSNLLIIQIFKQRKDNGKKFAFLFSVLAVFDSFACLSSVLSATSLIICFEGWISRGGPISTHFVHIALVAVMFTRTLSVQATIFITSYSYFGLSYPLRARSWFTWRRIRAVPLLVLIIAVPLNFPRGIMAYTTQRKLEFPTDDIYDIPSLNGFEYISVWSKTWLNLWERGINVVQDQLDFVVPLPTLWILNFLSYRKVSEVRKARQNLAPTQEIAIRPIYMFLPVVSFLLLCNAGTIAANLLVYINGVVYREVYFLSLLFNSVNSSANIVIYYWRSQEFRRDMKAFVAEVLKALSFWKVKSKVEPKEVMK
ncbi:unnamed protein product [Orchesella dallaii]|uniref:G-protein coupled receptors family 1 profile domain-containing protein n=1 Tax=Orchesella dallaii TaxID=48710 RepID=A0ABP1QCB3_9HEXA